MAPAIPEFARAVRRKPLAARSRAKSVGSLAAANSPGVTVLVASSGALGTLSAGRFVPIPCERFPRENNGDVSFRRSWLAWRIVERARRSVFRRRKLAAEAAVASASATAAAAASTTPAEASAASASATTTAATSAEVAARAIAIVEASAIVRSRTGSMAYGFMAAGRREGLRRRSPAQSPSGS